MSEIVCHAFEDCTRVRAQLQEEAKRMVTENEALKFEVERLTAEVEQQRQIMSWINDLEPGIIAAAEAYFR